MGLPYTTTRDAPDQLTISSFTLNRTGEYPRLTATFTETKREKNEDLTDKLNAFNVVLNVPIDAARSYQIALDSRTPEAVILMSNLLGGIYFNAVRAVLDELESTITDAEILTAIQTLGAAGTNIDSFIAQALEGVEADRRVGDAPSVGVDGNRELLLEVSTVTPASLEPAP